MQQSRHTSKFPALAVMLAAVLAGCATSRPPVQSMKNPAADFNSYSTFAWDDGQAGQPAQTLSIVVSSIRSAIAAELQRKGYTPWSGSGAPDLLLRYETRAAEKVKSNPFRIGIGMGGYGSSGGAAVGMSSPDLKNVTEGTLTLSIIDAARNSEAWNGRVSRELGKEGPDPELIRSAVIELLGSFPARSGALQ